MNSPIHTILIRAAVLSCCMLGLAGARAETLKFEITGPYNPMSWQMSSTPRPVSFNLDAGFSLDKLAGNFPDVGGQAITVYFASGRDGGGLNVSASDGSDSLTLLYLSGAQVYSGKESAPSFKAGSYALSWGGEDYSLAISAVPEPSTAAMALGGLGLVAWVRWRRRLRQAG